MEILLINSWVKYRFVKTFKVNKIFVVYIHFALVYKIIEKSNKFIYSFVLLELNFPNVFICFLRNELIYFGVMKFYIQLL